MDNIYERTPFYQERVQQNDRVVHLDNPSDKRHVLEIPQQDGLAFLHAGDVI